MLLEPNRLVKIMCLFLEKQFKEDNHNPMEIGEIKKIQVMIVKQIQELHSQLRDQSSYVSSNQREYKFSSANIMTWIESLTLVTTQLLSKDPDNYETHGIQLIIFDFFSMFPFNNFLHLALQGYINAILNSNNKELIKTILL